MFGTKPDNIRVYATTSQGTPCLTRVEPSSLTPDGRNVNAIILNGLSETTFGPLSAIVTVRGVAQRLNATGTQVGTVVQERPFIGARCTVYESSGAANTCDIDEDGVFDETCIEMALCDAATGTNGGCGSNGFCEGKSISVAKSRPI